MSFAIGIVHAGTCDTSPNEFYAGEPSDVIICAEGFPDAAVPVVPGADVVYQQPLRRCAPGDKRPGMHLTLSANQLGNTAITISAATGERFCMAEIQVAPARDLERPAWLDAMPLAEARYIDVAGIRTRYFDAGSGPVIVLVHGGQAGGANNSAQKWEQNFYSLRQNYRVIALDRLAQAGTDNLNNPQDYAEYFARDARHLEAFLAALKLENVTLVGHSQGGWPVTRVALNRPDLVRCLVNVDTVMVPDDMQLMGEALEFLMYTARFVDPPDGPTVASSRRAMALRYPTGNNITPEKAQRVVDQYYSAKTAAARTHMAALRLTPLHESFRALKAQAHADIAAGKLTVKSLVIWGELDPQVPLGLGQLFDQMLREAGADTELVVIEGTGHAPFVERPDKFNRIVTDYCVVGD